MPTPPAQRLVARHARGRRRRDDHAVVRTRRARAAANREEVCPRKEGRLAPPLLFCPTWLCACRALAGYRRADDVDLEGPAPALCRQLRCRRRPPQRLVARDARGRRRVMTTPSFAPVVLAPPPIAKELCPIHEEGRLAPPLLSCLTWLCACRALAGYRRADDVDLEGPAAALCRLLRCRR